MTCWPPAVTSTSSVSISMPSAAITWAMQSLRRAKPSVGPYWSARAQFSTATVPISAAYESGGKVEVSGSPPASEITSSRSVSAIRSRIAEERITLVRCAKRAA